LARSKPEEARGVGGRIARRERDLDEDVPLEVLARLTEDSPPAQRERIARYFREQIDPERNPKRRGRYDRLMSVLRSSGERLGEMLGSRSGPIPSLRKHVEEVEREGFASIGPVLSPAQVSEIRAFFQGTPCYNAHTRAFCDGVPRRIGEGAERFQFGSYSTEDALRAPHLLELAVHPEIVGAATRYLGCAPTLYSIHCWWSFPTEGELQGPVDFHRDIDDFRSLVLFVYLTDIDADTGPTTFIRQTHRADSVARLLAERGPALGDAARGLEPDDLFPPRARHGYRKRELYEQLFSGLIEPVYGPAGSGFLADPFSIHRGGPTNRVPRLVAWIRFGLYRNRACLVEGTRPVPRAAFAGRIPDDPETRYVTRVLIEA
jgi:hypothetical protein